jgi:hypothetical protein
MAALRTTVEGGRASLSSSSRLMRNARLFFCVCVCVQMGCGELFCDLCWWVVLLSRATETHHQSTATGI